MLALQVLRSPGHRNRPAAPAAVRAGGHGGPERCFWRGVLAHLFIVPPWVVSPALLVVAAGMAGAGNGGKGRLALGGLTCALATGPSNAVRALLCAAIAAISARGRRSRRALSLSGAGFLSFLTYMVSYAKPWILYPQRKRVFEYVYRWTPDYYQRAELRYVDASSVRPGKTFFAFHPHGCLSAGFTINGMMNDDFMNTVGNKVYWMIDPMLRNRNPGFRVMADSFDSDDRSLESCESQNFKEHMSAGHTVSFVPGGFLDAVAFERGVDTCVLSDRKAFIKLCLRFGYRLHPIYTFGECDTYHTFTGFKSLRLRLGRNNFPALAFFGWPLIPFLPKLSSEIITYVGRGIDFPTIASPSQEDVDHWHNVYVCKLQELFEERKAECGRPNAQLQIL